MVEWFQSPIAPWWALLALRAFSLAMMAFALERAVGIARRVLRSALWVARQVAGDDEPGGPLGNRERWRLGLAVLLDRELGPGRWRWARPYLLAALRLDGLGGRLRVALAALRAQAELTPSLEPGLSLGRSAVIAVGLVAMMIGITMNATWASRSLAPLTPSLLLQNVGLSLVSIALAWVSRPARAASPAPSPAARTAHLERGHP